MQTVLNVLFRTPAPVRVDRRFDEIDQRFATIVEHFVQQRQYTEYAFGRVEQRLDRLERKLDQWMDSQSAAARKSRSRKR